MSVPPCPDNELPIPFATAMLTAGKALGIAYAATVTCIPGRNALPDFPIIDAHVHLYDPANLPYAWLAGVPPINKAHLPADFDRLTAPVKVDGIVFVEVDVDDPRHLDEARLVEKIGRGRPAHPGIVAGMPLERGVVDRGRHRRIREAAACPRRPPPDPEARRRAGLVPQSGFRRGGEAPAEIRLQLRPLHLPHADGATRSSWCGSAPDVSFILDHIGKPGIKDGLTQPWRSEMRELAELPNVICKISGVVTEADHKTWTYDHVAPYVAHSIESFGFDRVAFGGDWPVSELATRYARLGWGRRPGACGRERGREAEALPRQRDPLLSHVTHRAGHAARRRSPGDGRRAADTP